MNSAYKHLESPLKIAELTLGQWGAICVGLLVAFVWGMYLSPLSATLSLFTAVYIGGIPAVAGFLAASGDFDARTYVRGFLRWRRGYDRYAAGGGDTAAGYVITERADRRLERTATHIPELDPASLWGA
jgi:hypothetical protein